MRLLDPLFKVFANKHFLSLLNNVVFSGLTFLTFRDMAGNMSKIEFGTWLIFSAYIVLAETVRSSAIYTPLIKFIAGATKEKQDMYSGGGWWVSLWITLILILVDLLVLLFGSRFLNADWLMLTHWFPLIFMISLPVNFAYTQLQAEERFSNILFLRILHNGLFLVFVIVAINILKGGVTYILYAYIFSLVICSGIALIKNWAPLGNVFKTNKESFWEVFDLSKYVMVTGVSSNLLRSSDTFLIGWLMGPQFVAMYKAPEKVLELIELPIRTIAGTAIPEMARELNAGSKDGIGRVMMKYTGVLTLILIPIILVCFFFAPTLMIIIAGRGYVAQAGLLRIFLIYTLMLPLDRFLGITLEILGKPNLTLIKVLCMLVVNVVGDIFCIRYFASVNAVAGNSFVMILVGIIFGHFMLKRWLSFSYKDMFLETSKVIRSLYQKFFRKNSIHTSS
jgi:O-antigen/teichoic acid export membrane protein